VESSSLLFVEITNRYPQRLCVTPTKSFVMSDASRMDKRFQKIVIGLALENELYDGREDRLLGELYENPSAYTITCIYRRFISSKDPREKEMAFWLELGLSQEPVTFPDKTELLRRVREIETVLYDILGRVGQNISQPLNDWLNYIANSGESVNQGYWIDAKILMSRAVEASDETSSKIAPTDVKMRHDLDILRSETRQDFEELLKASFRLRIPERNLDKILAIQALLLRMLRNQVTEGAKSDPISRYLVEKLATAEKLLIQEKPEISRAKGELEQALTYVERQSILIQDDIARRRTEEIHGALLKLLQEELMVN
jgi:hypothetical protein